MIRLINFSGEKFMKRSCAALKKTKLEVRKLEIECSKLKNERRGEQRAQR